jgi:uncharacterized protein (DUF302 family)
MKRVGEYAIQTSTRLSFDEAVSTVSAFLKEEGFGILTQIDVKETLKKKLDIDYKPFTILGACNPPFAHRALEAVPQVSVLLPCNVAVWDEGDHRIIATMEPKIMAEIIRNDTLTEIAAEVSAKIHQVIARLEQMEPHA